MNWVTGHEYLLEHFPDYDYRKPVDPNRLDIRKGKVNIVGFWQRAVNVWWAIEKCGKTGDVGLEFGSAGVKTPWSVNTDVRTGLRSHYPPNVPVDQRAITQGHMRVSGDRREGVFQRHDSVCGDTSEVLGTGVFRDNSFSLITANHVLEHMAGDPVELLVEWSRLLMSGGIMALVLPDQQWLDVMSCDPDHQHAWTESEFLAIAKRVPGMDVIEHTGATQINYHSFATILRKK
jgi:hypothetical protein